MQIIGVGHAVCWSFDGFEDLADCSFLHKFDSILVGEDIDVLPVDTDFVAYARSREQERLDELDRSCESDSVKGMALLKSLWHPGPN